MALTELNDQPVQTAEYECSGCTAIQGSGCLLWTSDSTIMRNEVLIELTLAIFISRFLYRIASPLKYVRELEKLTVQPAIRFLCKIREREFATPPSSGLSREALRGHSLCPLCTAVRQRFPF